MTLWRGFRFGMLLQLAVGPVCLFVFRAAAGGGFGAAEAAVAGVVLVDGLYIALAVLGVAAVLGRPGVRRGLGLFGGAVLGLFGAAAILEVYGIALLPGLGLPRTGGPFVGALALTASNPLTILFWAGAFSGKVAELGLGRAEVWLFGAGALLSSAVFLTAVAAAGSLIGAFLPELAVKLLNVAVGAALIFFGIRMAVSKARPPESVSVSQL